MVGASGALRGFVGEGGVEFAVVESDEKTMPGLAGDIGGEGGGGERGVELVSLWGGVEGRKKSERIIVRAERAEVVFVQRVGGESNAQLVPGGGAVDEPADRLGVEELVRKHHARASQRDRFADADVFYGAKRVGRAAGKDAARGLGAKLDEGMGGGVKPGGSEQMGAGGGDEFTEDRAETGSGVEITPGRAPDAGAVAAVVAGERIVKREVHEPVETQSPLHASLAIEGGAKDRVERRGRSGGGAGRCGG